MPKPKIIDIIKQLPQRPDRITPDLHRDVSQVKILAVHYDAVNVPKGHYDEIERIRGEARYHIQKNWATPPNKAYGYGLMYHYKVNEWNIYQTQPEGLLLWNANGANRFDIAICCDLGDNNTPSSGLLTNLHSLLMWLSYERPDFPAGRKDVYGHGELTTFGNNTVCPGPLKPWVIKFRKGEL